MRDSADDLVVHFGGAAARATFAGLPAAAVDAAKKSVLDTLGVVLAASGLEPAVRGVVDVATEQGGRPESTVLAHEGRFPAPVAAFANGAMAHCLDFDDQTPWGQHCASSVVPATLALAERVGGVSGEELITAVAVGQDLFARLRYHVKWDKDWNLSTVLAVYGAAAAGARVLRLSPEQTTHALGIASMSSAGVMEMIAGTGSDLRGVYAAFSAQGAVTAALLAQRGLSGIARLFEGRYGVFATYFGGGYDRKAMLDGLGSEFLGAETLYKVWPSVGTSHSHIQATLELVVEHDLRVDDIAEIRLSVGDYHALMCEPLDERRSPATLADAKFSLPFLVAIAAAHRDLRISDFGPAGLRDQEVRRAARKIVLVPDPDLDWKEHMPPGRVEVVTADGRALARTGERIPGSPELPLTWEALGRKFADCAAAAARPPAPAAVERVRDLVGSLETVPDVAVLPRILAGSG